MGDNEYLEAYRLGKKEQRRCLAQGRSPYLPVLDEILEHADIRTEQSLGLVNVPLDHVVGTSTRGRTYAFAANFMPILEPKSEFYFKWANLADAQIAEGIRDPIIAYEYMNRFYVVEGNKRVSVLKYFGADSIPAIVTRKLPQMSDDLGVKLYYEFVHFSEVTGYNTIEFTRLGNADKLLELVGETTKWDEHTKDEFDRVLFHFTKAFEARGGKNLPLTMGDALMTFLNVYGYKQVLAMTREDMSTSITKCWSEFVLQTEEQTVDLVMDPKKVEEKKGLLDYFIPTAAKKYTVAFLYPKRASQSDWIYAHDLGRSYLEDSFPDQINTIYVENVTEDAVEDVLLELIEKGANIIFEVAPQYMKASLKVAVDHPEVMILNCSLNEPTKNIRTYYARMYEAKFISGMVAGAMAENDRIAYVADYPIYGMIANINAFALGAACVNPRAKVYLAWSTKKDYELDTFLRENDIHYVSNQDMITPMSASREFGLYRYEDGVATSLVLPLWNWGVFYEKMIQSILAGAYQSEGQAEKKALNYWWGMSAGVIDLICSQHVPTGVKRLVDHMSYDVSNGHIEPFYGEIRSQDNTIHNKANEGMRPEDIMKMDWLVENIIGEIPSIHDLTEGAKAVVELKGVEEK